MINHRLNRGKTSSEIDPKRNSNSKIKKATKIKISIATYRTIIFVLISVLCILILVLLYNTYLYPLRNTSNHHINQIIDKNPEWSNDIFFLNKTIQSINSQLDRSTCDFKTISFEDFIKLPLDTVFSEPLLIINATFDWPANKRWKRSELLNKHKEKVIQTGSEASIVYNGGSASMNIEFGEIINNMRNINESNVGLFTFDVAIIHEIPEMKDDFIIPEIFRQWNNDETIKSGYSWFMLSLGPTRTGLPFHIHGKTWIGVVHGKKRWFVYPPGISPPSRIEKAYNPLQNVWEWFLFVYPNILSLNLSKPSLNLNENNSSLGYRPLECLQEEGSIVFLPTGWNHMTINIGETIGIGGQEAFVSTDRLKYGLDIISKTNTSYEGFKAAAFALTQIASDEEKKLRDQLIATSAGLIQLRDDNFDDLVIKTEDTWLVIYSNASINQDDIIHDTDDYIDNDRIQMIGHELAYYLKNKVTVGLYDLNQSNKSTESLQLDQFCASTFPCIRLYIGFPRYNSCVEKLNDDNVELANADIHDVHVKDLSTCGVTYEGEVQIDAIYKFVQNIAQHCVIYLASIIPLNLKSKRYYAEAIEYIRSALNIQPYNSESRAFLGELYGYINDTQRMQSAIEYAEVLYDDLLKFYTTNSSAFTSLSTVSAAAIYQKLGHTYLLKELSNLAIPLLQKSIRIHKTYSPAYVSLALAYNIKRDYRSAFKILKQLEEFEPKNPAIGDILGMMNQATKSINKKSY